jgi:hypothetical protein
MDSTTVSLLLTYPNLAFPRCETIGHVADSTARLDFDNRQVLFTDIQQLGSVTVPVEPYGSERNPPINLLNLRLGKIFALLGKIFAFEERFKIETTLAVFNVFNSNAATSVSYLTGPNYKSVSAITPPLIARPEPCSDFEGPGSPGYCGQPIGQR